MADPTMRDVLAELATLRGTVATLHGTVREQGAELAVYRRRRRHGRSARRLLPLLLAALLVALVPLATLAANPFVDLNPGSPHNGNIDAISNAGITKGCDPTHYCPTDNVTRQEMASFLARTAGLGGNPPIANAATALTAQTAVTAQTATSTQNATNATNAVNAQTAVSAQTAQSAVTAQSATNATNATNAQNAASAGNANTVGGYAPSGLVRAARGAGNGVVTDASVNIAVFTLTLDAPGPGVVLVNAGAYGFPTRPGGSTAVCPCEGILYLRHVQKNIQSPYYAVVAIASFTDTNANAGSASVAYAFPVAAGTNAFELRGGKSSPGSADILLSGQGTALFVPFGADGAGATGAGQP